MPVRFVTKILLAIGVAVTVAGCTEEMREQRMVTASFERGAAIVEQCRATRCERLDLDGAKLEDFGALSDMTHVKALMLSRTNVKYLADIADMVWLEELHVRGSDVVSFAGISRFTNLQVLHISDIATAADEREIASLPKLQEFAYTTGESTSVAFLGEMENLTQLTIFAGQVADFAPVIQLRQLEKLYIRNQRISNIEPLLKMPKLKVLGLRTYTEEQRKLLESYGVEAEPEVVLAVVVC